MESDLFLSIRKVSFHEMDRVHVGVRYTTWGANKQGYSTWYQATSQARQEKDNEPDKSVEKRASLSCHGKHKVFLVKTSHKLCIDTSSSTETASKYYVW